VQSQCESTILNAKNSSGCDVTYVSANSRHTKIVQNLDSSPSLICFQIAKWPLKQGFPHECRAQKTCIHHKTQMNIGESHCNYFIAMVTNNFHHTDN
jgi:hypothetical protein